MKISIINKFSCLETIECEVADAKIPVHEENRCDWCDEDEPEP